MALREKDRNRKNVESAKRLVELLKKGNVKTSTKAVTVGTEREENLRGQVQHWFTILVIRLLREKAEELRRAPVP